MEDFKRIQTKKKTFQSEIKSEKKLNDLLNHVPAAIYSAKPSGNYPATYISGNIKKITGHNSKDFIKNPSFWIEHIHPDDRPLVNHEMKKFLKKGNHRYEYRFKCKDGKYIWINDVMTLSYDDKKQPIEIIGYWADISEEKKAKIKLKDSEEKWNSLVNHLPKTDRIIIIDKYGKILYVNKTVVGNENIVGKKIDDFLERDSLKEIKKNLHYVFDKQKSRKYDTTIITPTGEKRYYNSIAAPLKKDNKIIAVLCIAIDNTRLRNIENELSLKAEYINKIINNAREIIFTVNKYHKIILWNKSAEKKTGYKKNQIINKKIDILEIFQEKNRINEYITDIFNGKKSFLKEILIKTNFGNNLLLGVSSSLIKDESNNVTDILFVCWDITHDIIESDLLLPGRSYLTLDENIDRSIKIFEHYSNEMQKKLIISRDIKNKIKKFKFIKPEKIEMINLSLNDSNINNITELKKLVDIITNYVKDKKKSIIFIDRFDYFISIYSFENVIKSLYEINDQIRNSNSILILRINPTLFTSDQRIKIEQEFYKIPSKTIKNISLKHLK